MSTIEIEDVVTKRREQAEQLKEITKNLDDGNASLVRTYALLAKFIEEAAEVHDLFDVQSGLEAIETLVGLLGQEK